MTVSFWVFYILLVYICHSFTWRTCVRTRSVFLLGTKQPGDPFRAANGVRPSIHPITINTIAEALRIRSLKQADMPLRLNESLEPLDIALTAGKIASDALEKRQQTSEGDGMSLNTDEQQTIAGRVLAVIMRFEELESLLYEKANSVEWVAKYNEWRSIGVLKDESKVELVDEEILQDPLLRLNRAECLLALFIETVERPGLMRNGVTVPCMDVDFLDNDRYDVLLGGATAEPEIAVSDKIEGDILREQTDRRPSLHPVTINVIADALRLRAKNSTTSPLRFWNDSIDSLDIHLTAGKLAEKAVIDQKKTSRQDDMLLTEEEANTIAGRIVAVIMRFEDLEQELLERCQREEWIEQYNKWDAFGILKDENCVKTLDERILSDPLFAVNRAECLLALFLLNIEGPGMKASGSSVPGGSSVDFLDEDRYSVMLAKIPAVSS